MDYVQLGKNIFAERKKNNLTQEELAEKADISSNFLGKIERADSIPSLATVYKIAQSLGVGMDYLIGDSAHDSEYKLFNAIVELNKLSSSERDKFIDFINTTIKYFKS